MLKEAAWGQRWGSQRGVGRRAADSQETAAPQVSITWVTLVSHQWPCHLRRSSVLNFTMNPDRDTCYAIFSVLLETSTSVRICKVIWRYHMNKHRSRFRHKQSVVSLCLSPMWSSVCSCLGNVATHTTDFLTWQPQNVVYFMEMLCHRPTQSRSVKLKENYKIFSWVWVWKVPWICMQSPESILWRTLTSQTNLFCVSRD